MPIYVYRCDNCDTDVEKRQGFSEAPLTTCEVCAGSVRRVLQPVGVIFKGSGFYSTDYRGGANGKTKPDAADGGAADGATAETKTDAKPDAKAEKSTEAKPAESGAKTARAKAEPAASATKSQ